MSLESRISKTVVEYIDTAITSPPVHQPLQDADKVYDSFVKAFARLSAGIDMKQTYQRKPHDPAYLPTSDNFAINLARLFLAFRAREQVPLALRPQPDPPLSLCSVDLAKVTERTFNRVLFLIANANERASCSKAHGTDPIFTRTYEEFKQVAPRVAALPSYVRKSDDPHWLVRYSDQAIKTVQALLAIQARLRSGDERAMSSGPVPVLSLDSVIMKDITHRQFLDTLNGALQKARASRPGASPTHPAAPTSRDPFMYFESGSDTYDETESESQGDWDTDSDGGDEDDVEMEEDPMGDSHADHKRRKRSFDDDVSTDDEDPEFIPRDELREDFDDVIVFDSEADYQRAFKEWNDNEADEPLLQDVLGPLLDSRDEKTRSFTIALLQKVLGVGMAPIPEMKKNVQVVLRELRRLYRIAHTAPWRYSSEPDYQRTITPFVYCYSVLSDTAFFMRSLSLMAFKTTEHPDSEMVGPTLKTLSDNFKKSLRQLSGSLEGLPECQKIMTERARIARIRLDACFDALVFIIKIKIRYEKAFTVSGTLAMPELNVKYHRGLSLDTAVQRFRAFDNSRLGMEYFPEYPGSLIKGSRILFILDSVYGLKFIAEFRKSEDIKKAANTAGELLRKWNQRSLRSHNSLFVALQ